MGIIAYEINLGPENVKEQDHILADDVRHGILPENHYWSVVWAYRDFDVRQTGNDHRWAKDHPWVAHELSRYDEWCREHDPAPPHVPHTGPPGPVGPGSEPGAACGTVPEPGAAALFGAGVVLVAIWAWLRKPGLIEGGTP